MKRLSALIIAKNEEETIQSCIDSVSFADEIVVIDSGSNDRTIAIAKKNGCRTIKTHKKNFAQLRTFAASKATGKWLFYIDADERVTSYLKKEIARVVSADTNHAAYTVKRKNFYFGEYEWPVAERLTRLFRASKLTRWHGAIHESPEFKGTAGDLDGFLLHYTHRDLYSMLAKTNNWSEIESDMIVSSDHPPMAEWRFLRIMITKFLESYIRKSGWRAGTAGLIESIFQAYSYFVIYAKVWEKQTAKSRRKKRK